MATPDSYFRRCELTWTMDAKRARRTELYDECIHKPSPRFQWLAMPGHGWTLAGTLPTIGPDGEGTP